MADGAWKRFKGMLGKFNSPFVLITIIAGVGVATLIIGPLISLEHPKLGPILSTVGTTALASGVFMAVLKSLQFGGVFADELQKVLVQFHANHNPSTGMIGEIRAILLQREDQEDRL